MPKPETEAERLARLDREAGARGRARFAGRKAATRNLMRDLDDKAQAEAKKQHNNDNGGKDGE